MRTVTALPMQALVGSAAALFASVAQAQVEPAPATNRPRDGAWLQASVVVPVAENTDIAVQYGELGGLDVRYISLEGRQRVGDGFGLSVSYAHGERNPDDGPTVDLNQYRLGVSWTNEGDRIEVDGRLWAELLDPSQGKSTEQLRGRLRVSFAITGVARSIKPRLFVADEIFAVAGEGIDRNRLTTGLRASLFGERLDTELYYQRTDYDDGLANDRVVLSLSYAFEK